MWKSDRVPDGSGSAGGRHCHPRMRYKSVSQDNHMFSHQQSLPLSHAPLTSPPRPEIRQWILSSAQQNRMPFRVFFLPWTTRTSLLQNGPCTRPMAPILHQTTTSLHRPRHQRHSRRRQKILCRLIQNDGAPNHNNTLVAIAISSRSINSTIPARTHLGRHTTPGERLSLSSLAKHKCNHRFCQFKTICIANSSHPPRPPPLHLP